MLTSPTNLSRHQRTTSAPPLSSSFSSHRSARPKTSNPCNHRNQQYSIVGLTNAAGTLVERYSYTAYGTLGIYDASGTVRTNSTYANRYTYTGREYGADLNLYHFRARWYDPSTGGFISRDPLGYVDGMSLYRGYFGVQGQDPSGQMTKVQDKVIPEGTTFSDSDLPKKDSLICPQPCDSSKNCTFEVDVFRAERPWREWEGPLVRDPNGQMVPRPINPWEKKEFTIISLLYTPPYPTDQSELQYPDFYPCACYGGFNRAPNGYIEWRLINGDVCRLSEAGFFQGADQRPDYGMHPMCARSIAHFGRPHDRDRDGNPRNVGGLEIWLDVPNQFSDGPVHVNFSIETECLCGTGHVDLPNVPHHSDLSKSTGTISIDTTVNTTR